MDGPLWTKSVVFMARAIAVTWPTSFEWMIAVWR